MINFYINFYSTFLLFLYICVTGYDMLYHSRT